MAFTGRITADASFLNADFPQMKRKAEKPVQTGRGLPADTTDRLKEKEDDRINYT